MKTKKIFGLAVAMVATMCMALSFTACSDDEDDSATEIACYATYIKGDIFSWSVQIEFYSNKTTIIKAYMEGSTDIMRYGKGTWSGNLSDNGTATITITHKNTNNYTSHHTLDEMNPPNVQEITITEESFIYDATWDDDSFIDDTWQKLKFLKQKL